MYDLAENDLRVLDLLWRHGTLSRTRLAELTGLTVPSLSRISQRLISQKIAREASQIREGKRGQPTNLLEINPKAGFTLGAAIAPDVLSICLLDFHGQVIGEKSSPLDSLEPGEVAHAIEQLFSMLLDEAKIARKKVIGAGVAVPGQYRNATRLLHTIPEMSAWRDVDIPELFEPILGMPVWCDNVGKASAFLEARFGSGRPFDYFTYIHLGHGIGGGLVMNRQLLRGLEGNAASFGGLLPLGEPRPSARDLLDYLHAQGIEIASVEQLHAADIPKEVIRPWLVRAAKQLSWLIEMIFWTVGPEAIVVGGLIPSSIMRPLLDLVRPSEDMAAVGTYQSLPPILLAAHNGAGPHRGAATLSLQRLMPVSPAFSVHTG